MAHKPVRSGSKLCILEYGVAPSRVEWGDLLAKYVAVNISSPHMNGGKFPSFIKHRVISASVCPSLSDTPFCCGVLVAVYSMLIPAPTHRALNSCPVYSPPLSHRRFSIRSPNGATTVMLYWCSDSAASVLFLSKKISFMRE